MLRIIVVPVNGTDIVNFRRKTLQKSTWNLLKKDLENLEKSGKFIAGVGCEPC